MSWSSFSTQVAFVVLLLAATGESLLAPVHDGRAFWIKVSASADGSFLVRNARNEFEKTYR
ncbi:MAG: hypothetical protein OEO79_10720 [Gemmatimonadota bacterium]|nr:hypothetical protein [Gemmatimonadota bacterium]MDH3422873.1 hypothetical protein [Gemmatimonadota bacterium]